MTTLHYPHWTLHRGLFNEVNRTLRRGPTGEPSSSAWSPAVDIREHADKFVLLVDVPGLDPQTIDITLEKTVLTLSGSRTAAAPEAGVELRRSERSSGRFTRRFNLPDTVDAEAVTAQGSNGVLEITIPKRPLERPRKIAISH